MTIHQAFQEIDREFSRQFRVKRGRDFDYRRVKVRVELEGSTFHCRYAGDIMASWEVDLDEEKCRRVCDIFNGIIN